jgi:hypothetical protein
VEYTDEMKKENKDTEQATGERRLYKNLKL